MKKIKDIMTGSPQSCSRNESIQMVASKMSKANIGFLPVVDENREVVGTITDRDVALAIGTTNQPVERLRAQDIMNSGAHTVTPDDEVAGHCPQAA
jgi:predicted transcriptional regulator